MTEPDSPEARPLTRRELRQQRERERNDGAPAPDDGDAAAVSVQEPPRSPEPEPAPRPAVRDQKPAPAESTHPRTVPTAATPAREASGSAAQFAPPSSAGAPALGGDAGPSNDSVHSYAAAAASGSTLESLLTPAEGTAARPKKRRGGAIAIIVIIVALIVALALGGMWAAKTYGGPIGEFLGWNSEPTDYEPGQATGEAVIMIQQGDTGWEVSQALYEADVTRTESVFYDMLVDAQQNPEFRPGMYELQRMMTASAALERLEDPEARLPGVAFPEGYANDQIAPVIATALEVPEDEVVAALEDPSDYGVDADSLEGWLFPGTYEYTPGTEVTTVIQDLVDRTRSTLEDAGVPEDRMQRVLTIASILEREARAEEDFYRVSRVIQNRLDDDMRLQMDSTAQYGYGEMHDGDVFSSAEALEDDNAWNTYVHTGLPVGPISNPGALAIDAAVNPTDGNWLYFVTVNLSSGETRFASTLAEHEEYVAELQQWCADNPDETGCG